MILHRLFLVSLSLTAAWTAEPPPAAIPAPVELRAATPVPKPEERWQRHHEAYVAQAKAGGVAVAFFGDSITQRWTEAGLHFWRQHLLPLGAANFGIGGDKCEHILWRLGNGELEGMRPRVVVLMAGTNNLWDWQLRPADIVAGISACLATIRQQQPQAKILLVGVIPQGRQATGRMRGRIRDINALLAALPASARDSFLDLGPVLLAADGTLPEGLSADETHLTAEGYEVWWTAMEPVLRRLLDG